MQTFGVGLSAQTSQLQVAQQAHHAFAAEQEVTVPSQVRDCPGTLVHELAGVQLKVADEQVVVQLVANRGVVAPRMMAIKMADRVKSFRI